VRDIGERYENWLRLSHFIDVVEKSPAKTLQEAALEGAKAVRKYHFDYTDFTPFEKAYMMRVFPFYKWTRKAMPMMATMMFTNPGKMSAFPRTMNSLSNQLSLQDISADPNGMAPNFTGIAPTWVQHLWGYQIDEEHDKSNAGGHTTSVRVATPQLDALTSLGDPLGQGATLLNPLIKWPVENALSQTISDNVPGNDGFNVDLGRWNSDERVRNLMGTTPQGAFLAKAYGDTHYDNGNVEENKISQNDFNSFVSGIGFYDTFLRDPNSPYASK